VARSAPGERDKNRDSHGAGPAAAGLVELRRVAGF